MKKDFFNPKERRVLDVALGTGHTLVLAYDMISQKNVVYGYGSSKYGQLGTGGTLTYHNPIDLTGNFPSEVVQISTQTLHSLFLTKDGEVYGCGRNNKG